MNDVLTIMLPPFVACLVLTGIHTYLGLHVVLRGVIFVDLALAQIAALGSTFAFLLGFEATSTAGYFYSLGFTFLGAAVFSLTRLKNKRVPQEALIGIIFVVASSAAILIADRAPQGAEHVKEMLTGSILWVTWPTIWKTLAIYAVIGLFHVVFRKRFLMMSMDPEEVQRQGWSFRWWDFLFYVSFGVVITSAVAIAGVLLVFSFLIIPAVIAILYSDRVGTRLVIGWVSGSLVSLVGLLLSYQYDFPSGPAVVCTFGVFLLLAGMLRYLTAAQHKAMALARVGGGVFGIALLLTMATQFRPATGDNAATAETQLRRVRDALEQLGTDDDGTAVLTSDPAFVVQALDEQQLEIDQQAVQKMGELRDPALAPIVAAVYKSSESAWMHYYAAVALIQLGDKDGIHHLLELLRDPGAPAFLLSQAADQFQRVAGRDFGFEASAGADRREAAVNRMEVWWHQNVDRLRYDEQTGIFETG